MSFLFLVLKMFFFFAWSTRLCGCPFTLSMIYQNMIQDVGCRMQEVQNGLLNYQTLLMSKHNMSKHNNKIRITDYNTTSCNMVVTLNKT